MTNKEIGLADCVMTAVMCSGDIGPTGCALRGGFLREPLHYLRKKV